MQRQIGAYLLLEEETWEMMQDVNNQQELPHNNEKALAIADEWIDLTKNRALSVGWYFPFDHHIVFQFFHPRIVLQKVCPEGFLFGRSNAIL